MTTDVLADASGEGLAAAPGAQVVGSATLHRRRRWAVLTLLAVGVMISFIDRTSLSAVLATPDFRREFRLSDVDRGLLNSVFFWSYAALQIPLGWLVDRRGVKWPYAICFAGWCVATAAIGLVTDLTGIIALRLIVGAAEAIVVPASWRWLRTNFEEGRSGVAVGVYMLGSKLGPALGAPLAAWLIAASGWRTMFLVLGAAGMAWLVPWILVARDEQDVRTPRPLHDGPAGPSSGQLLRSPLTWGTLIVIFCYNYFTFYCMTWMPSYLVEERGLSLESMGLYTFFSFAGIGVVALAAGWVADRIIVQGFEAVRVRKAFTIAGFALASTVVLGARSSSLGGALFWNVASLSGLGLATANHLTLCRLTLVPSSKAGFVAGVQQVATAAAGIVAPIMTGWLLRLGGNYTLPIYAILLFLLMGAASTAFLLRSDWVLRDTP